MNNAATQAAGKSSVSKGGASGTSGLTTDDFYQLLAAQLKYQDADNPMDTSEMMAQMVQTQMIESIQQMSAINLTTYASSMVGRTLSVAEVDGVGQYTGENTEGVATGVLLGENPIVFIGEKGYLLSQIMSVGKVPEIEVEGAEGTA